LGGDVGQFQGPDLLGPGRQQLDALGGDVGQFQGPDLLGPGRQQLDALGQAVNLFQGPDLLGPGRQQLDALGQAVNLFQGPDLLGPGRQQLDALGQDVSQFQGPDFGGSQPPPPAEPVPSPMTGTDSGGFMGQLQTILEGLARSDPFNIEQLRNDPVTAALLSDLSRATEDRESDRIEELQRLGIVNSGSNIETGAELDEAALRAEFDILGRGAERARSDRDTGLGQGIDLAGLQSNRELGFGQALGHIGGEPTIGGRQADLDVIAAILASLDPELALDEGVSRTQLAQAILGTSGFSDEDMASFLGAFGLSPEGQGGGSGVTTPPGGVSDANLTIVGGQVVGGNNPELNAAINAFFAAHPHIAQSGDYTVQSGKLYNSAGLIVANWNPDTNQWVEN